MNGWKTPWRWASLVLVAGLFLLTSYRAATQSIVHDEAYTWQLYLASPVASLFEHYDANHHFLATLLMRLSTELFGYSELAMRLPALLAAAWYFHTAWRLSAVVLGGGGVSFLCLGLLCGNPLILDFLVAARGYGLALACLPYALCQVVLALGKPEPESGKALAKAGAALSLAVMANLTFLLPAAAAAALLLWRLRERGKTRQAASPAKKRGMKPPGWGAEAFRFLAPVGALAVVFFLAAPLHRARGEHFYTGAQSILDSLRSLMAPAFSYQSGLAGLWDGTSWRGRLMVAGALVVTVLVAAGWYMGRKRTPRAAREEMMWFAAGTALGAALLALFLRLAAAFPYPAERTGIYFYPLATMSCACLCQALLEGKRAVHIAGMAMAVLGAAAGVAFAAQWTASSFYLWRYDADSRAILEYIGEQHRGKPGVARIGAPWQFEPSFNFYRETRRYAWMRAVDRSGARGQFDYYVLPPDEMSLEKELALRVIRRFPVSGAVVAVSR